MKKLIKVIITALVLLLGAIGSPMMASDKTDKLEERNPVLKFGYKYVSDNAERTDSYTGYLRLKLDLDIIDRKYTFIPEGLYRYEKRDDETVNDKYLTALLVETDIYKRLGVYSKVSFDKDIANEINSRSKYGIGLYQYLIKTDKFLFKLREGLQYVKIDYTKENGLENSIAYGKLSALTGYYYNENMFIKAVIDYDLDLQHSNNVLDSKIGVELKITDKLALETLFSYEYRNDVAVGLRNDQRELTTSIVYQF